MRYSILILLILFNVDIKSQNLVLNPSFEEYSTRQLYPMYDRKDFFANHWSHIFLGTFSTVDFYSRDSLDTLSIFNVPENFFGNHPSMSGDSYIGMIVWGPNQLLEHITGSLKEPLVKGKRYQISLYVRHAGQKSAIKLSKLEVLFSSKSDHGALPEKFVFNDDEILYHNLFSNLKPTADAVLPIPKGEDSITGWQRITSFYTASGGEEFITLGLFYQGDSISSRLNRIAHKYQKSFPKKKKRQRFLKNIEQEGVDFISFNADYEVSEWFSDDGIPSSQRDFAYYFIDMVSVVEVE